VLLIVDFIAVLVFHSILREPVSLHLVGALIVFRIVVNVASFLMALVFHNIYVFYSVSFAIILFLTITSGAVLPIEGLTNRFPWLDLLNPIDPFLKQELWNPWILIVCAFMFIWLAKGEKFNA